MRLIRFREEETDPYNALKRKAFLLLLPKMDGFFSAGLDRCELHRIDRCDQTIGGFLAGAEGSFTRYRASLKMAVWPVE